MNKKWAIFWETSDGVIHQSVVSYDSQEEAQHLIEVFHELFPANRYFIKEIEE
jgi:hypothetical protein